MFTYLFDPNPGMVDYSSRSMLIALGVCGLLFVLAIAIRIWRRQVENPVTKKLSASWVRTAVWFGVIGVVLVISRVEAIQFFAMRFLWVLWMLGALLYVFFQFRQFRTRHYQVLPRETVVDPRDRYLPGKKKH